MIDTVHLISDSLSYNQTGLLTLAIDTLKVPNVPDYSTGFNWADFFKPSIDLIIALIGAFVLVWQYLLQKRKESAERIIERLHKDCREDRAPNGQYGWFQTRQR